MNDYREYDHTAPVRGVPTVFASVEFPAERPPREIVIAGHRYVRKDDEYHHLSTEQAIYVGLDYNGYDNWLCDIRDYIVEWNGDDNLPFPHHLISREQVASAHMVSLLWMVLVVKFGDYGTSPRYGWIEDRDGALAWLDSALSYSETCHDNDGKCSNCKSSTNERDGHYCGVCHARYV